jgi:glycosyltransferase involved in cell wall biosynthesis
VNILFLTAYAPVLHMHGGGVRMFHNIRILAAHHSVRVVTFIEGEEEREMLRPLEEMCESVIAIRRVPDFRPHWLSVRPFLAREFSTPEMYRAVEKEFSRKRVDVLQCEYLQMAQFYRPNVFTILTLHEMLSANAWESFRRSVEPPEKFKLFYRWMQMLRYETYMPGKFDRVITMTKEDAGYLRSYIRDCDVRAIPIGIDPSEFLPAEEDRDCPIEVLFVGNFRHTPNIEAVAFLIERIAPYLPHVRFNIPGSHVPDAFLSSAPANVRFPGYIPDTRVLYPRPNTIVAAPLFSGTGQRVKLLEAFSMACPVITTSIGAMGFPVRNGVEAFVADTAETFTMALNQLIASEELRRDMGRNAREMIERHFSWARIGEQFLEVVNGARV